MELPDILKWVLNFFELAAAVTGFYYFKKWKGTRWALFPYFLLLTLVTELIGKYLYYQPSLRPFNYIVYRYVNLPATVLFYLYMVYWSFTNRYLKKAVLVVMAIYVACWLVEEFVLKGSFVRSSSISFMFGNIGLLVFILIWVAKLARKSEVLQYKRNMYFWLYGGIMIYYIIMLPFSSELRYSLNKNYPDLVFAFWYIMMVFDCIMYSFFTIGFKWAEPKSSYSL